eukprot:Em0001g3473a
MAVTAGSHEGEALAAWLDLAEETKKDYETAKKQLIDGLMPIAFTLLDKFHARKLLPGESPTVFSHDLRKLIVRAMPEIDSKARDQLLLHQFIAGLPLRVSRELRAAGETKELGVVTLQRARLLLSLEDQHQLTESGQLGSSTKQPNEREQAMAASIDRLTQQVAALSEQTGSHSKVLSPGKLQRGACSGQHAPRHPVSPSKVISVAAVKSKIATLMGSVGDTAAEIMLDSGSSVSLLRQELAQKATGVVRTQPRQEIRLVTAAGESLPILGYVKATVRLGTLEKLHDFVVMKDLITAVILGTDFLQLHGLVLDFTTTPVTVAPSKISANQESAPPIKPIWTAERLFKTKKCPVASIGETMEDANQEMTEECAIPKFGSPPKVEFPEIIKTCFVTVVDKFKDLFVTTPGTTSLASHRITTAGTPQLLEKGIITESSSPWLAPAVYVRKKTGEIRLCVDYRELNKKTTKDAYPLPLIDDVQDQLSGSAVFSKLDLQSGYWQLPVDPNDREKTAFSPDDEMHAKHLNEVFMRLRKAGLTLRGKKCVTPDREKVKAVEEWPIPQNATEVRQFLGLASYYRRFIQNFADVAAPLHNLTQKDVVVSWSNDCSRAFKTLKCKLIGAPILVYPRVDKEASQFQHLTDASALGLGAVLEQGGHVIAYASRILTKAEANYSVIQRECLAVVYGIRQFRHYLLGRSFQLWTDHKPLQWLSEQRMEGMLCRWALALQKYKFTVEYRKGSHNDNADALSRRRETVGRASHLAATRSTTGVLAEQIRIAQQKDDIIQQVYQANSQRGQSGGSHLLADTISYGHNSNAEKTMAAFGVKKTHTTAYHPQGDGMVERFNLTLLQLLRAYVDQQNEWEKYLPLALYAYRTSTLTSTSVSPFELMFGRQPKDHTEGQTGYEVDEYQGTMQAKLAELMDFVETHMVDAARHQKQEYDKHMGIRTFKAGDLVWLSIPTAGKLDPRWEGGWKVKACKSPINMEVSDGTRNRVVHVNRLRHLIQMAEGEEVGSTDRTQGNGYHHKLNTLQLKAPHRS